MEIGIVKTVQGIANNFLDRVFWLITKMGEEIFFLLVFAGIYLLYSKKFAFKYTIFYLISVGINAAIKNIIRRPRPYVASSEVINRLPASSYSFPSGHSQGYFVQASTGMIEINSKSKKNGMKISLLVVFVIMGMLVMLSRLYWGQHYLTDTLVGATFGLTIPFILEWVYCIIPNKVKDKLTLYNFIKVLLVVGVIASIVLLVLDISVGFTSRKVNIFVGVYTAMSIGYIIDKKLIKYNELDNWKVTILKGVIAYPLIIGLYLIFDLIFDINGFIYFVVYFVLGLVVSIGLPYLFSKIFRNKNVTNNENGREDNINDSINEEKVNGNS